MMSSLPPRRAAARSAREQPMDREREPLARELVSDEDGHALLGSELQLGARGKPLLGRGRTEPFEVDAVRDDFDLRADGAVRGAQGRGIRLGEAHHRTVCAPAVPDAVAQVDEDMEGIAVAGPGRPAPGPHGCEKEPVVDVDVADHHVVVRDRDRVGAVGEELAGAHRADRAEPHHAPAAPDSRRGSCPSASAARVAAAALWNVNRSTVAPSARNSRSRFYATPATPVPGPMNGTICTMRIMPGIRPRRGAVSGPRRASGILPRPAPARAGTVPRAGGPPGRARRAGRPSAPSHRATAPSAPTASRRTRSACAGSALATRGSAPRVARRRRSVPAPTCTARASGTARVAPPEPVGAERPVGLLGVEEEALVEPADLVERLGAQQQHRSDHEVRAAPQPREPERLEPVSAGRREEPLDARGRAVIVDLRGADAREVGLARAAPRCSATTSSAEITRVGVQQQHVGAGHEPVAQRDVHARREAAVAPGVDVAHAELGAERGDLGQRRVVDDGDGQPGEGLQRPAQQVGCTVRDDDDLEAGLGRRRMPRAAPIGTGRGTRGRPCSSRTRRRARVRPRRSSAARAPPALDQRVGERRRRRLRAPRSRPRPRHREALRRRSSTTGTPHAIASTATRPNCSVHDGVGSEGTASTSMRGRSRPRRRARSARRTRTGRRCPACRARPRGRRRAARRRRPAAGAAASRLTASSSTSDALLGHEAAEEADAMIGARDASLRRRSRPRPGPILGRQLGCGVRRAEPIDVDAERDHPRASRRSPSSSAMRAASALQAETPAALRSAHRSSQRNGIG